MEMDYIIDEEDVKKEFEDIGVVIEDNTILKKIKDLCIVYDSTAEWLAAMWVSFINVKGITGPPDLDSLDILERDELKKKAHKQIKQQLNNSIRNNSIDDNDDVLGEYGGTPKIKFEKIIDSIEEQIEINEDPDTSNNIETTYEDNNFTILETYGKFCTTAQWAKKLTKTKELKAFDENQHISKPFKYMHLGWHECREILLEYISEIGNDINSKLDDPEWDDFAEECSGERLFFGQIVPDVKSGKMNESSLILESRSARRLKMDVSKLQKYSFFPGQVIALKGTKDINKILVDEIIDEKISIKPFPGKNILLNEPLHMVLCSGPYHLQNFEDKNVFAPLKKYAQDFEPDFIIFLGPFVDERKINHFTEDPKDTFKKIMIVINQSLFGLKTEAIVIPSTRDFNHANIFPSYPFTGNQAHIKFFPNPSFIDISGVVVGMSSIDSLLHLSQQEISINQEPGERMKQICKHLLSQQNFYPLYPPNIDVNIDYSKMDFFTFTKTPHILITPSDLKYFVKDINGCICINPGRYSKGMFARIRVEPMQNVSGSLNSKISVEINKF